VAEDIAIAVISSYPEVSLAGRVPAILDGKDFQSALTQVQTKRALVGFEAGIALYLDNDTHERPPATQNLRRIFPAIACATQVALLAR
jgi:hypothetical protein